MDHDYLSNKYVTYSIIFIAVVLLILVLKNLQSFLRPFFLAIIITLLLNPLERFSKKIKVPFWSTLTVLGVAIIILLAGFAFIGNYAISESIEISKQIPESQSHVSENLDEFITFNIFGQSFDLSTFINAKTINNYLSKFMNSFILGVSGFFSELFLALLFVLFLFPSHQKILDKIKTNLDESGKKKLSDALLKVETHIKKYISTKTLISFFTALISGLIMWTFGVKYVFILMLLIFMLNFIPTLGSIVSTFIAFVAFVFQVGLGVPAIFLGITLTLVQQLFGNYLEPKIAGERLKISPLVILFSLFLWHWIWGPIGMIFAVPITSIIKIILENFKKTEVIAEFME